MRKVLISLLLASAAATPALARPDYSDRQAARADRQEARSDRQQSRDDSRSERSSDSDRQAARPERVERQVEVQRSVDRPARVQQVERQVEVQRLVDRPARVQQGERPAFRDVESFRAARDARTRSPDALRNQRLEERQDRVQTLRDARDLRQSTRPLPRVMRTRTPVVSETPQFGTQPPLRVERDHAPVQWSSNWRHNNKYDWHNWRNRHRSLFHFGFYYDPFGWDYQRYSIGWRLWPSYYSSSFWLNDPWMYRLPYAPPGTRWIRYYDDALLVDTWSGQVVDVIYDFFW